MPYEAEISRINPTAFILIIDQSYSMKDYQNGDVAQGRKCDNLATVINRIINDLVIRCSKGEEVFDYFDIALIGYGGTMLGVDLVGSAFGGNLAKQNFVPISKLADEPIRIEKRLKQVTDPEGKLAEMSIDFPVWLEPVFSGNTPMAGAMAYAFKLVADWLRNHPKSFPPIVIHITDGYPTDADPRDAADAIRSLSNQDGNVLMFNLHLSEIGAKPIVFPSRPDILPNEYSALLFEMSSLLPDKWYGMAAEMGLLLTSGARAFAFNADLAATIRFLEIGTRQPTQLR